jgi:hypothetical protein
VANWTVATTLERLGVILEEEGLISGTILDKDDTSDNESGIPLSSVVSVMKDRIVRDQFTPKAQAQLRKAKPGAPKNEGG